MNPELTATVARLRAAYLEDPGYVGREAYEQVVRALARVHGVDPAGIRRLVEDSV